MDAYWDLIETIAWIVHRNLKAVCMERLWWRLLVAPRPDEMERARRRRPLRPLLSVWDRPHLFFRREGGQALAALNRHCAEGTIYADGRRELFGPRLPIPPLESVDLVPSVMTANLPADALVVTFADADARYGVAADKPAWRDVRFRVADIMREFPPKPTPAEHELCPDPRSWPEPESRPEPWPGPELETTSAPELASEPETAPPSQPVSYPPRFPRNQPDRIAVALLRDRPEGRWADVETMIDDFTHDSRSGFKSVSERNFKEAMSRLARHGFKQWKWL
jgi:hypothetical protein